MRDAAVFVANVVVRAVPIADFVVVDVVVVLFTLDVASLLIKQLSK